MGQSAQRFEHTITHQVGVDYLLSLPDGFNAQDRSVLWPLIFFLHGAGERCGYGVGLEALQRHGLPKRLERKNDLPFVVVSPQCPMDEWWGSHIDTLIGLLEFTIATYPIDPSRVYLTGLSMGGFGTWQIARFHPDRFAAIAPICGGMPWFIGLEESARILKNMPIWAFHGAKDDIVPVEESQRVVQALKAAGSRVKFTVYRNAGHDSWTKTYANPKLYEWFLEHKKNA
jgi:predicted peptidase